MIASSAAISLAKRMGDGRRKRVCVAHMGIRVACRLRHAAVRHPAQHIVHAAHGNASVGAIGVSRCALNDLSLLVDTSLRLRRHTLAVLSPKVSSTVVIRPVLIVGTATFRSYSKRESVSDTSSEKLLTRINFPKKRRAG